jgi:hypothetical protein
VKWKAIVRSTNVGGNSFCTSKKFKIKNEKKCLKKQKNTYLLGFNIDRAKKQTKRNKLKGCCVALQDLIVKIPKSLINFYLTCRTSVRTNFN